MADKTISALTAVASLDGTEPLPLVQGGTTKKATVSQVLTGQLVTESGTTRTLAATDNGKIKALASAAIPRLATGTAFQTRPRPIEGLTRIARA